MATALSLARALAGLSQSCTTRSRLGFDRDGGIGPSRICHDLPRCLSCETSKTRFIS